LLSNQADYFGKQATGLSYEGLLCIVNSHKLCEDLVVVDPLLVHSSSPRDDPSPGRKPQNVRTIFNR